VTSFQLRTGAAGSRILSFGHYQPSNVVTNDDLAKTMDTNDAWIQSRVGIKQRRLAGPDESVADMAVQAGGKALANSGLSPADIDLVVVATCTQEAQIPNASAQVADRLGIVSPGAYDVNAACAGFCYALANASDAVRAGSARNVLVIGAEKLSQWVDWTDRSTSIIFADGAGAAVVGPSDETSVGPVVWGSAGDMAEKIFVKDRNSFLYQEGQSVFRWTTTQLPVIAKQVCAKGGVTPEELGAVVLHQANLRIIEPLAKRLGAVNAVIARDIIESGNTSAASIPIALSKLVEKREIPAGAPILLFGFGGGLSYAGQIIRCP
jgi:3-oxoacyl-[acyl-carrier-protein] synthase III